MSVDMDVIGVMAAYLPVVRVCTAQPREAQNINLQTNSLLRIFSANT